MTQVCVIGIYVPDIQKAVDFYTNVLGFEVNKQYGPKINIAGSWRAADRLRGISKCIL